MNSNHVMSRPMLAHCSNWTLFFEDVIFMEGVSESTQMLANEVKLVLLKNEIPRTEIRLILDIFQTVS